MKTVYIVSRWIGTSLASNRHFVRRDAAARALVNAAREMIWDNSLADTRRGHDVHNAVKTLAREVFDGCYRQYFDERPTLHATGHSFFMRDTEKHLDRISIVISRDPLLFDNANAEEATSP